MKTKTILLTATILLSLLIVGVGCEKEDTVTDIFHTWKFQGFGNVVNSSFEKATPTDCDYCYKLIFSKDGKFTGMTTTNSISGEFTIDRKNMKIINVGGTLVGELGNGKNYFNALQLIESYEIEKNKLKLYYNQGQNYLLFNLLN